MPNFIIDKNSYPSKAFNNRPFLSPIKYIILHYTVVDFKQSIEILTNKLSAHFLIADNNNSPPRAIYQLVDVRKRAWHAGISNWKKDNNLNDKSIGIEIVNLANENNNPMQFPPFTKQQLNALIFLLRDLQKKWHIKPKNILAHADIAPLRKFDPGPQMIWQQLAQHNLAIWYDKKLKAKFLHDFKHDMPTKNDVIKRLKKFGYHIDKNYSSQQIKRIIKVFQMRFRPEKYDGLLDSETIAIIFSLT